MENDAKWAELGEQVSLLKSLSQDINNEVKSQNSMLDKMGQGFTSYPKSLNCFSNHVIIFVDLFYLKDLELSAIYLGKHYQKWVK